MPEWIQKSSLVARRDWFENISTKMFWIGALLGPILFFAMMIIVGVLAFQTGTSSGKYAVIDQSNGISDEVRNSITRTDLGRFLRIQRPESVEEEVLQEVDDQLRLRSDDESEAIRAFVDDVMPYLSYPSADRLSPTSSSTAGRFATWWTENTETVIELAPNVSFAQFDELAPEKIYSEEELNSLLKLEVLLGYFIIPENIVNSSEGAKFVTMDILKTDLSSWYSRYVSTIVRGYRVEQADLDLETARWVTQGVYFSTNRPVDDADPSRDILDVEESIEVSMLEQMAQFAPAVYLYILWFTVLMGSTMLMTGTVEEKSTKLVEVLLSNVDATHLMDGKLVAIALTMMTIVGVWIVLMGTPMMLGTMALPNLMPMDLDWVGFIFNPAYVFNFALFLVLGFAFYGYLFSAVGSVCSSIRDAQVLMAPVSIILVVPILMVVPLAMDPDGPLALIMRWIPPFTPFVMMGTAAELPSLPIYLIIVAWLLLWVWGSRWIAGRIYSKGMLLEEKPKGIKGLAHLVRA